jgi:hypothetical protein
VVDTVLPQATQVLLLVVVVVQAVAVQLMFQALLQTVDQEHQVKVLLVLRQLI